MGRRRQYKQKDCLLPKWTKNFADYALRPIPGDAAVPFEVIYEYEEQTGEKSNGADQEQNNSKSKIKRSYQLYAEDAYRSIQSQREGHISSLPIELLYYMMSFITRAIDLENLANSCRAFFLLSRDRVLWWKLCLSSFPSLLPKVWDYDPFSDYRTIFLGTNRPRSDGIYVSLNQYLRYGQRDLDNHYNAVLEVKYYRYLLFEEDGLIYSLLSNESPKNALQSMKYRNSGHRLQRSHSFSTHEIQRGFYELKPGGFANIVLFPKMDPRVFAGRKRLTAADLLRKAMRENEMRKLMVQIDQYPNTKGWCNRLTVADYYSFRKDPTNAEVEQIISRFPPDPIKPFLFYPLKPWEFDPSLDEEGNTTL